MLCNINYMQHLQMFEELLAIKFIVDTCNTSKQLLKAWKQRTTFVSIKKIINSSDAQSNILMWTLDNKDTFVIYTLSHGHKWCFST